MSAWYAQPWSSLIINKIRFPVYSDLDINEDVVPRDFGELEPNLNGVMRHMYGTDPENSRKVNITWSSSRVRRPPAFSNIWRGDEIEVVPIEPWTVTIPAGQTSITLHRDPYAGSVLIENQGTGEFVDDGSFGVAGRVVTLESALAGDAIIGFLPVLTMLVDERQSSRGEFGALSASWRLSAKEK